MNEHNSENVDVSVIVAAHNVENYIARAIHSALSQNGVTVEVVVADDASSDGTWRAIENIRDKRVRPIRLATNEGPGTARNKALICAQGKWIAILDGDDQFLPGRLRRCLDLAKQKAADMVVDNLRVSEENTGKAYPIFAWARFGRHAFLNLEDFMAGNLTSSGRGFGYLKPLIARSFLERHAVFYDPDLRIGEDYIFMADLLAAGAVCAVEPTEGYLYIARAHSISYRLTPADVERMQAADERFLVRHRLAPVIQDLQKRRRQKLEEMYAYNRIVDALKRKAYGKALAHAIQSPAAALQLWEPVWVRVKRFSFSRKGI